MIAAAFMPLVIAPAVWSSLVFVGLGGEAYGVYIAVDQALMADVLPTAEDNGKGMGILNIANTAPQIIVPGMAALVLTSFGLGCGTLFTIGAVLAVLSAVLISATRRIH